MINKFKAEQGKKQEDKKGFNYKNKTQCRACKMYGHDMCDDHICHIGAQYYWISEFVASDANKQIYKANVKQYKEANTKHFVNLFNNQNVCTSEGEHQEKCEQAYMKGRE